MILIVDDEEINITLLSNALGRNTEVSTAMNGADALDMINRGLLPDIILLDILMPGMDGFQVCQKLKMRKETANVPIIFITALGDVENEEKGLTLGAVDYIYKPFNPAIVRARVNIHLELFQHRAYIEKILKRRTKDLQKAYDDAELLREVVRDWIV